MIDLEAINLNLAKTSFALANVPMYIARRMREDPAIVEIAVNNSSDDLIAAFERQIIDPPSSLREQVYPFALAVALAIKQDVNALRYVSRLEIDRFRWLSEMIEGLIELQGSTTSMTTFTTDVQHFAAVEGAPLTSEMNRSTAGLSAVRLG